MKKNQTNNGKAQLMFWYNYVLLIIWIASFFSLFYFIKVDNLDGQVWSTPAFLIGGAGFIFSVIFNLP